MTWKYTEAETAAELPSFICNNCHMHIQRPCDSDSLESHLDITYPIGGFQTFQIGPTLYTDCKGVRRPCGTVPVSPMLVQGAIAALFGNCTFSFGTFLTFDTMSDIRHIVWNLTRRLFGLFCRTRRLKGAWLMEPIFVKHSEQLSSSSCWSRWNCRREKASSWRRRCLGRPTAVTSSRKRKKVMKEKDTQHKREREWERERKTERIRATNENNNFGR